MRCIRHVHFVGIGGTGMCGIAEVLLNEGYVISGSDIAQNAAVAHLMNQGANIYIGHHADYVEGADVVVTSSAVGKENVEVMAAYQMNIPVVPRAEMLAELMRFRKGIAIAGTHGKTTTTSLVASILAEAKLDPTFVIGGRLNSAGVNARLGSGEYLIVEADESDASFLHLQPLVAVVTNIDADHMENYRGDFSELKRVFVEFLHHLPFYGLAVLCIDDPEVREILPSVFRPVVTYGFNECAHVQGMNFEQKGIQSFFTVKREGKKRDLQVCLNLPGRHNALNALAAIAIATDLELSDEVICRALSNFSGVARRFQLLGQYSFGKGEATLIDDYGHHPREIAATIEAARNSWPDRRLTMIFQPHRYSRTQTLFDDFVEALSQVDVLLILEVYSAGEEPIVGASARDLCRSLRLRGHVDPIFVSDHLKLPELLGQALEDNDLLLTQGAGSVSSIVSELLKAQKLL